MLGRLRMSCEQCETQYLGLSERIFGGRKGKNKASEFIDLLRMKAKFDSAEFEDVIREIIVSANLDKDALLRDPTATCKVSVPQIASQVGADFLSV